MKKNILIFLTLTVFRGFGSAASCPNIESIINHNNTVAPSVKTCDLLGSSSTSLQQFVEGQASEEQKGNLTTLKGALALFGIPQVDASASSKSRLQEVSIDEIEAKVQMELSDDLDDCNDASLDRKATNPPLIIADLFQKPGLLEEDLCIELDKSMKGFDLEKLISLYKDQNAQSFFGLDQGLQKRFGESFSFSKMITGIASNCYAYKPDEAIHISGNAELFTALEKFIRSKLNNPLKKLGLMIIDDTDDNRRELGAEHFNLIYGQSLDEISIPVGSHNLEYPRYHNRLFYFIRDKRPGEDRRHKGQNSRRAAQMKGVYDMLYEDKTKNCELYKTWEDILREFSALISEEDLYDYKKSLILIRSIQVMLEGIVSLKKVRDLEILIGFIRENKEAISKNLAAKSNFKHISDNRKSHRIAFPDRIIERLEMTKESLNCPSLEERKARGLRQNLKDSQEVNWICTNLFKIIKDTYSIQ